MTVSNDKILEARRAIRDGNEDCIGLERLLPPPKCESDTIIKWYKPDGGPCPYTAKFKTRDGKRVCQKHAEIWAATNT